MGRRRLGRLGRAAAPSNQFWTWLELDRMYAGLCTRGRGRETKGTRMSLYESTLPQFKNTLTQIGKWLEAGVALAASKKFDANVLLSSRLAPDQYPLLKQIQAACDAAKATPARLTG